MKQDLHHSPHKSPGEQEAEQSFSHPAITGAQKAKAANGYDVLTEDPAHGPVRNKANLLRLVFGVTIFGVVLSLTFVFSSIGQVGYRPKQPYPFNHAVHAGDLKLDCAFCHDTAQTARYAAIPAMQNCTNCHRDSSIDNRYRTLFDNFLSGTPIAWTKVNNLPDFVFFHHGAHASAGIACDTCHGRVERMQEVSQEQAMTMKWCLDCHRVYEGRQRPGQPVAMGVVNGQRPSTLFPSTDCSTCHR